jgi:microcystin-dependent protein
MLNISSNSALFSLLGTAYGGDGRTTFALPDLRGRHAEGVGTAPGMPATVLGQQRAVPGTGTGGGTLGLRYIICVSGIFPMRP